MARTSVLQLFPALILISGMAFMPFTPRWLAHHGREDEARRTLAKLRGADIASEIIELEYLEIKAQSEFEKRTAAAKFPHLAELTPMNTIKLQFVSIASLFKTMPMFRRVIVATVTMFFQQWTGINAILYYAPSIFKSLGQNSNTTNLLATGVVGIVMFVATFPTLLYIDRVGRKPVLTAGAIAMALCHFIVACYIRHLPGRLAIAQGGGVGRYCDGLVICVPFRVELGPLCMDLGG